MRACQNLVQESERKGQASSHVQADAPLVQTSALDPTNPQTAGAGFEAPLASAAGDQATAAGQDFCSASIGPEIASQATIDSLRVLPDRKSVV